MKTITTISIDPELKKQVVMKLNKSKPFSGLITDLLKEYLNNNSMSTIINKEESHQ